MEAIEQYFSVVLFVLPQSVVVAFEAVNETLKCDHPNESTFLFSVVFGLLSFPHKVLIRCQTRESEDLKKAFVNVMS